jgi:2-iminobutanoate/2-iminopropanoate deaminase
MAGQIGLHPSTGALVPGGFAEEFRQAIENIAAIASAAGSDLGQVAALTVYLTDERDFAAMNSLYADLMTGPVFPARTTLVVNTLPLGALVELSAVLVLPD